MADPTYTPVMKVGLLGTISNLLSRDATFSRCSRCAAETDMPATHTTWHNDNDAQIAAALTAGQQAMTNMCSVCRARVAALDMYAHLMFHYHRSRQDPIETPAAIHADTGVNVGN